MGNIFTEVTNRVIASVYRKEEEQCEEKARTNIYLNKEENGQEEWRIGF